MLGEWSDPARVAEYLSREIPHRDIAEGLLLDALPQRVERALDLGTGDGCGMHDEEAGSAIGRRRPPSRLLHLFFKAPIVLYRLRMGLLLSSRFLLLTHTGRRTGRTRQTVIEVVSYDHSIPEAIVIAAWGKRAQWVRNLGAAPAISVQIGSVHWTAPEHRILDPERAAEVIAAYRREHALAARLIGKFLGWPLDPTDPAYAQFIQSLCAVAFRPSTAVQDC